MPPSREYHVPGPLAGHWVEGGVTWSSGMVPGDRSELRDGVRYEMELKHGPGIGSKEANSGCLIDGEIWGGRVEGSPRF